MDVRGKVKFLPPDVIGNAEYMCFLRPSDQSMWTCMDVRRSVNAIGGSSLIGGPDFLLQEGADNMLFHNSWVKIQHIPSFGGAFKLLFSAYEPAFVSNFIGLLQNTLLVQIGCQSYLLVVYGLTPYRADKLVQVFTEVGAHGVATHSCSYLTQEIAKKSSRKSSEPANKKPRIS